MALKISSVNLRAFENSKSHRTDRFEAVHQEKPTPIFRRGQEFDFDVTFSNRPYNQQVDKLRVLFHYVDIDEVENEETPAKGGSWVTNSSEDSVKNADVWSVLVVSSQENTLTLKMRTPTSTPIGCWKMVIKSSLQSGSTSETYKHPEIIFLFLNPWHKDDGVFMPDTSLLEEYVMNDVGKMYLGGKGSIVGRHWLFGQFEMHVLPILMEMLIYSGLDYAEKADPIKLTQVFYGMHDNILVGNWSRNYEDGTPPTMWTGSAPILKQYAETGNPVKYAQCWVFASVACTLCRAIGIPARVVSNIGAAVDNDESLTIDSYYNKKNEFLSEKSEKVWTFHACTEVWMARPDLPPGYGGWQVFDPTNDLGPCSLEAVKRGEVGLDYDVAQKIGEVNADLITWREDANAVLGYRKVQITTDRVGYQMLTKKPHIFDPNGDRDREDVMYLYKNPEGSKEERLALYKAAYKCSDRSCQVFELDNIKDLKEIKFKLVDIESISIGDNFFIVLDMENTINEKRTVNTAITVISRHYNGVKGHTIKKVSQTLQIPPKSKKQIKIEVTVDEYVGKLVEFCLLKTYLMASVEESKQIWSTEDDFKIDKPPLIAQVIGILKVGVPGKIVFGFQNPLKFELTGCHLAFDCPGLMKFEKLPFRKVLPKENVKIETNILPNTEGKFTMVAMFHSEQMHDIMGSTIVDVSA